MIPKKSVYQTVTDKLIKALEGGKIPWQKPWELVGHKNLATGKLYRGINQFLLSTEDKCSHLWVTYNQAKSLGGFVKAGEKSSPVVFWTMIKSSEVDPKTGKPKLIPFLKHFNVFDAVHQCEGLEKHIKTEEKKEFNPIAKAESIVADWQNKPPVSHGGNRAYYVPSQDTITLPTKEQFLSSEGYYGTLFHELIHSTGHISRLNRKGVTSSGAVFGSEVYSQEELVAELGAAFLCVESGIERTFENSVAYIQGWLRALKNDNKMIVFAAGQAQKAADLVLGLKTQDEESE